jgi:hypothetical protein
VATERRKLKKADLTTEAANMGLSVGELKGQRA